MNTRSVSALCRREAGTEARATLPMLSTLLQRGSAREFQPMRYAVTALVTFALAAFASCGTTHRERTTSGAAAGAVSGAGVGAFAGPAGAAIGAVVGGGAGAVTGAVTTPKQINLGKPVWNRNHSLVTQSASKPSPSSPPPPPIVTAPPPRFPTDGD